MFINPKVVTPKPQKGALDIRSQPFSDTKLRKSWPATAPPVEQPCWVWRNGELTHGQS